MPNISDYTNWITDSTTRQAVYDLAYQMTEGNFTFKISTTVVTPTAAELNKLDDVAVTAAEMDYRTLNVAQADLGTAGSVYVPCRYTGTVKTIDVIHTTTNSGGAAVITPKVQGIAMSGALITITAAAPMAVGTVSPTAGNTITAGQYIELTTDGGPTGVIPAMYTILIELT